MSAETSDSAAEKQSERQKAPGRIAHMQRLNAERRRRREAGELKEGELGGRPITTGEFALAARIQKGLDPNGLVFPLLAERRDAYLADLGGLANASEKEADMCGDLAAMRLEIRRIDGELLGGRRIPWKRRAHLRDQRLRYALAFKDIAIRLGLQRRAAEVDRTLVIRRWGDSVPSNGQDGKGSSADSEAQDEHKADTSTT